MPLQLLDNLTQLRPAGRGNLQQKVHMVGHNNILIEHGSFISHRDLKNSVFHDMTQRGELNFRRTTNGRPYGDVRENRPTLFRTNRDKISTRRAIIIVIQSMWFSRWERGEKHSQILLFCIGCRARPMGGPLRGGGAAQGRRGLPITRPLSDRRQADQPIPGIYRSFRQPRLGAIFSISGSSSAPKTQISFRQGWPR